MYAQKGETGPSGKASGGSHTADFLECIKSRKQPHADVELGRLSTTICHLGNICARLKRDVRFDPRAENFGDDKEANALLTKEYREPYTLPHSLWPSLLCGQQPDYLCPMLCVIGPPLFFQLCNHGRYWNPHTPHNLARPFHVGLNRGNQGKIVAVGIQGRLSA